MKGILKIIKNEKDSFLRSFSINFLIAAVRANAGLDAITDDDMKYFIKLANDENVDEYIRSNSLYLLTELVRKGRGKIITDEDVALLLNLLRRGKDYWMNSKILEFLSSFIEVGEKMYIVDKLIDLVKDKDVLMETRGDILYHLYKLIKRGLVPDLIREYINLATGPYDGSIKKEALSYLSAFTEKGIGVEEITENDVKKFITIAKDEKYLYLSLRAIELLANLMEKEVKADIIGKHTDDFISLLEEVENAEYSMCWDDMPVEELLENWKKIKDRI